MIKGPTFPSKDGELNSIRHVTSRHVTPSFHLQYFSNFPFPLFIPVGSSREQMKAQTAKNQTLLDELIPKSTGREAMLDKKRSITSYHRERKEKDIGVVLREEEVHGDGEGYQAE